MTRPRPSLLYISQDGAAPSGISSYGFHVLEAWQDAHMLLLNATQAPPTAHAAIAGRIHCVSEDESHDVKAVARWIGGVVAAMPGDVAILPNTGDTPWSATVEWAREADARERSRVRVLGIVHSDVETQYAGAVRYATFAAGWIGVSRKCAAELGRRFVGVDRAVRELAYPMPLPGSAATKNRDGPLRLVYAGRLEEPQKRVSRLAALLHAIAQTGLAFRAAVVGDGPARIDFESAIMGGPASAHVTMYGSVDRTRLADILRENDVFLLTSAFEGLPLALLEAMAAGLCPMVMRMESGIDDVIVDGENGIVVPQGDITAMVDGLCRLDRDRSGLERLKRAAHECIARDFSPERHFARLERIIDECRQSPPPDSSRIAPDPTAAAVRRLVNAMRGTRRPIVVYGAGMFGRKVIDALHAAGTPASVLVDSDASRWGTQYRGLICRDPGVAAGLSDVVFAVGSIQFADEIAERIRAIARSAGGSEPTVVTWSG